MLETKETLEFDSWPNLMRTHANLWPSGTILYTQYVKNVLISQNLFTKQPIYMSIYVT